MQRRTEHSAEVRLQAPCIAAGQQHSSWSGCGSQRGAKSPDRSATTRNARSFTGSRSLLPVFLPETAHVEFHESLDLFLRQLLAEGGHVLAPPGHDLHEVRVGLLGLKPRVGEVLGHQLPALRCVAGAVFAVTLRAELLEERGRVVLRRIEKDAEGRETSEAERRKQPGDLHPFLAFSRSRSKCSASQVCP